MGTLAVKLESAGLGEGDFVAADAGGDDFTNDGRTVLWIRNQSGVQITVTGVAKNKCSHGFLDDEVITVDAGEVKKTRRFPVDRFNAGVLASVTYSAVAGVTVAAMRQESYS